MIDDINLEEIDEIIEELGGDRGKALPILQRVQEKYRYLPELALRRVCERTAITPAQITGLATFYSQFRLAPVGKYTIRLCFGTACYVRGAERIAEAISNYLNIEPGSDTDPNRLFTVQNVACLGCCSLAPCMMIEEMTYGHLSPMNVKDAIEDFLQGSES